MDKIIDMVFEIAMFAMGLSAICWFGIVTGTFHMSLVAVIIVAFIIVHKHLIMDDEG